MDRRGFLGAMLAAGVAPAVVRAESLMRLRPIVFPSLAESLEINMISGNPLLTPTSITMEMLVLLRNNLKLMRSLDMEFMSGTQWPSTVRVRRLLG